MKQTNRRGRPKASNPRNIDFKIRLTKKEYSDLEAIAKSLGWTKAKVFRNALNIVRCKDCALWGDADSEHLVGYCTEGDGEKITFRNEWCCWAERRNEDEQTY